MDLPTSANCRARLRIQGYRWWSKNDRTSRRLFCKPIINPNFEFLSGSQWIASNAGALDMTPHQFVRVQIGRIARQDVHGQLAVGGLDVLAYVGLLVRRQSICC